MPDVFNSATATGLALIALLSGCAPAAQGEAGSLPGPDAAADAYQLTLAAQLTAFAPTFSAQATGFAQQATAEAPLLDATATAFVATASALGDEGLAATAAAQMTAAGATLAAQPTVSAAPPATPLPPDAASPPPAVAGNLPMYTGGDENDTARVELMAVGESRTARIDGVFDAHNWVFEGQAGQSVTISVVGAGDTDPAARLIAPDGSVLTYQQDVQGEANTNVQITRVLAGNGLYTVRVEVWVPGEYTITIRTP